MNESSPATPVERGRRGLGRKRYWLLAVAMLFGVVILAGYCGYQRLQSWAHECPDDGQSAGELRSHPEASLAPPGSKRYKTNVRDCEQGLAFGVNFDHGDPEPAEFAVSWVTDASPLEVRDFFVHELAARGWQVPGQFVSDPARISEVFEFRKAGTKPTELVLIARTFNAPADNGPASSGHLYATIYIVTLKDPTYFKVR